MKKRVLLIQPPAYVLKDKSDMNPNVPLGIAYIAGVLEREECEVRILDAFVEGLDNETDVDNDRVLIGLAPGEIEKILRDYMPDVVGVSSLFTMQRKNAHNVCAIAKKICPRSVVIMGGAHPSAEPESVLNDANVDYVVLGEGETAITELLSAINGGKDVSDIEGVALRVAGEVRVNRKNRYIEDLDSIPFPARHLLPMEKYFKFKKSHGINKRSPYASIVTSRGCPFGCTFCSTHTVWGRSYRFRSAENVIKEIKHLVEAYDVKELLFEDDNLTLDRARAAEIFRMMINEEFDLIWRTPNGVAVKTLDEELLDLMKKSGCYQLGFAVESGSQRVLDKVIRKPLDIKKIPGLVMHARKLGIDVIIFSVVGMPGETLKEMRETFRFSRSLGLCTKQHISIATPYPGSELYELCRSKGYFASHFDYDKLSMRNANIDTEMWSAGDVMKLVREETKKNDLCAIFENPSVFFKALIPRKIKYFIKSRLAGKRAVDEYTSG